MCTCHNYVSSLLNSLFTIPTQFTTYKYDSIHCTNLLLMGWLWIVGSLKLWVSFAEYSLYYRAFLQKRPIILRSLLSEVTPYMYGVTPSTFTIQLCYSIHYITPSTFTVRICNSIHYITPSTFTIQTCYSIHYMTHSTACSVFPGKISFFLCWTSRSLHLQPRGGGTFYYTSSIMKKFVPHVHHSRVPWNTLKTGLK